MKAVFWTSGVASILATVIWFFGTFLPRWTYPYQLTALELSVSVSVVCVFAGLIMGLLPQRN